MREYARCSSTFDTYLITGEPVIPTGSEINRLTIPAPAIHFIVRVVEGELFNFAPIHGHQVYILISVLIGGESQPFPIGRDARIDFLTRQCCDAICLAALTGGFPKIPLIAENDQLTIRADGGVRCEIGGFLRLNGVGPPSKAKPKG